MRSEVDNEQELARKTSVNDVMNPPEQLPAEGALSPISAQMLNFGDDDLFSETLRTSDFHTLSAEDVSTISAILDSHPHTEREPDMFLASAYNSVPQSSVFSNQSFDPTTITDVRAPIGSYSSFAMSSASLPIVSQPLPSGFEDDGLLSLPGFMGLEASPSTSCSFMDPAMSGSSFYSGSMGGAMSCDRPAFYPVPPVVETIQGDYQGFYGSDGAPHQRIFCSSGDSQKLFGDAVQLVNSCVSPNAMSSEVTSLDESSFKVGRLSVEERREKIHRYMKKRNERNFSKKIKYACRKTLADSRPRVRGRFAKNDDYGETPRSGSGNHDEDEEVLRRLKEEEDTTGSSEMYAHLGSMNPFVYTPEPWIPLGGNLE